TNLWTSMPHGWIPSSGYAGATDERRIWIDWMGPWSRHSIEEIKRPQAPVSDRPIPTGVLRHPAHFAPRALPAPFLAPVRPLPYSRPGHPYRPVRLETWMWRDAGHRFGDARLDALAG